jgi:thiamine kinase-like enzyme
MAPHEWIRSHDGRLIKVDASQHGDDHFFPGPTDIHWDLAGAIVEWNMDADAEQYLLSQFRAKSGMIPDRTRLFSVAYSAFRASYFQMAWMATGVESEKSSLERAYRFYRAKIDDSVRQLEGAGVM